MRESLWKGSQEVYVVEPGWITPTHVEAVERDAFATAVLGGSTQLQFDSEGRVTLPEDLITNVGINEEVVFIGKGQTFEIWEPKKFEEYSKKAREVAQSKRASLRLNGGNNA